MKLYYLFIFPLLLFISCCTSGNGNNDIHEFLPEGYSGYSYDRVNPDPQIFYFDSVAGSNDNSGNSMDFPLKDLWTLDYIDLIPGDSIQLKRGSHWDNNWIHVSESGTSENPITISTYGSGDIPSIAVIIPEKPAVLLEGEYIALRDLFIAGTSGAAGIQTDNASRYITISSCEVSNTGIGILFRGSHHLLENSFIHDLNMIRNTDGGNDDYGANGVFIEGENIRILHNRFENCKAPSYDYGTDGGTIEIWRNCSNIEIAYNWSRGNNGFMELGGKTGDSIASIRVHHNQIINDIVIFLPHITGDFSVALSDVSYENNSVLVNADNGDYSLFMSPDVPISAGILSVKNNIFYTIHPNRVYKMASESGFVHEFNLYNQSSDRISYDPADFTAGMGEITGSDPLFIDLESEDMHLQSGSSAVNAGTDLGYNSDYDGNAIPYSTSLPDIGCYESGSM